MTTPVGHRTLTDIQPSLRPEQHTARSDVELVTRNTTRLTTLGENGFRKTHLSAGQPLPGFAQLKVGFLLNQTDFTATRVPGGPEAGRALAFRRPSVTNTYFEQRAVQR